MVKGLRLWLPAVAAAAILPIAAATAASASTADHHYHYGHRYHHGHHYQRTVTATTRLVHRGDSGGAGNNWAYDYFSRTAKVTLRGRAPLIDCGILAGRCFAFTASLSDHGAFRTIPAALAPNQGAYPGTTIGRAVWGRFHGYGLFATFYASTLPRGYLVPRHVYGDSDPSYLWPELFFPAGTSFSANLSSGAAEGNWGYYYWAPRHQHWVDASFNGGGQLAGDGNITS